MSHVFSVKYQKKKRTLLSTETDVYHFAGMFTAIILSLLMLIITAEATAGAIYKYKDANDRWQFSDQKPENANELTVLQQQTRPPKQEIDRSEWVNLKLKLEQKIVPQTALETATLAVVSIQTPYSVGSGFFITDSGYLVTNRHVVRPRDSEQWRKKKAELDKEEREIEVRQDKLELMEARFKRWEQQLKRQANAIVSPDHYFRSDSEYERFKMEYEVDQREYETDKAAFEEDLEKLYEWQADFEVRKNNFNRRSANTSVSQTFTIQLKNGETLEAQLEQVSEKHDLALLKLNGHLTPFLSIVSNPVLQGQSVYAIGSPLGQTDSITSGIISRLDENMLVTDATVLPGNSGGPLLNEAGAVIGVNTMKLTKGKNGNAEGFGLAIPVAVLLDEYREILSPTEQNAEKTGEVSNPETQKQPLTMPP